MQLQTKASYVKVFNKRVLNIITKDLESKIRNPIICSSLSFKRIKKNFIGHNKRLAIQASKDLQNTSKENIRLQLCLYAIAQAQLLNEASKPRES